MRIRIMPRATLPLTFESSPSLYMIDTAPTIARAITMQAKPTQCYLYCFLLRKIIDIKAVMTVTEPRII